MTTWTKQKLGEIADVVDSLHITPVYSATGYPMVRVTDIKPGFLKTESCLKVAKDIFLEFSEKHKAKKGDIVFSRVGSEGIVSLVAKDQDFCLGQNTAFIIPKEQNNFLFYWLNSPIGKYEIKTKTTGSTQRTVSLESIKTLKLLMPFVIEQEKISSVLSTYDELIENNEKRIKILEEMAQRLYTEWFVKFKFPGHEKVNMIDSGGEFGMIPEGWEISQLGNVVELAYGKALKEENRIEGTISVYGSSGLVGTHNEKIVSGPGIVVGRKGNVGSVFWVENDFYPIDTTFYVKSPLSLYFVYYLLKSQSFISGDAAVPGLNRGQTYNKKSILPPRSLIDQFSNHVNKLFLLANTIRKPTTNLKQMRDLLIPQLVTGKRELK